MKNFMVGGASILAIPSKLDLNTKKTLLSEERPRKKTFAFSPALAVSIMAVWLVSITRNVMGPLYDAWVNQRLDSDTRATVISMSGQVDAIGQVASGPIAGLISLWSIRAAITGASLLLIPALPLIARANRLHAEDAANAASPEI